MKNLILFLNIFFFVGCSNNQHPKTSQIFVEEKDSLHKIDTIKRSSLSKPHLDTAFMKWINSVNIILPYGFEITGCSIKKNGITIFKDSTDPVYYNKNYLYPIIRDLGNNCFELLLQYANGPNMDLVQHFIIKNNKVIKLDTLPSFFSKARKLDNDSLLEYAGVWDYGEVWGENADSTDAGPIYFYEVRKYGIVMDSILTIKINKRIYGKTFDVFHLKNNWGYDNHKISPKLERAFDTLDASF
jgi:hypothetical protein